jgi:GNAT superfamily N-acetyltransferase
MSDNSVEYREILPGEERLASELLVRTFQEFIGGNYPRSGVRAFLSYASPTAITRRLEGDHRMLVATQGNKLVGVADIDDYRHIDLLFVDKAYHGKGVARGLINHIIDDALAAVPDIKEITADTSDYGRPVYEALGFESVGPEMIEHGRHFRRMRLKLKKRQNR